MSAVRLGPAYEMTVASALPHRSSQSLAEMSTVAGLIRRRRPRRRRGQRSLRQLPPLVAAWLLGP